VLIGKGEYESAESVYMAPDYILSDYLMRFVKSQEV